jgi:hypothetical protein
MEPARGPIGEAPPIAKRPVDACGVGRHRAERGPRFGGRRKGGCEGRPQHQLSQWEQPRPKGETSPLPIYPPLAFTRGPMTRISFSRNPLQDPGKDRPDGPGKIAQLDQQGLHDQKCPVETANHHLGFPVEPIVLQLINSFAALAAKPFAVLPDGDAAEAPGILETSRIRFY